MVEPTTLPASTPSGMKITQLSPARAACAATAVARFPVDAHETVVKPNSRAFVIATERLVPIIKVAHSRVESVNEEWAAGSVVETDIDVRIRPGNTPRLRTTERDRGDAFYGRQPTLDAITDFTYPTGAVGKVIQ